MYLETPSDLRRNAIKSFASDALPQPVATKAQAPQKKPFVYAIFVLKLKGL